MVRAAELVRDARRRAGLSQAALAARAGIAQSVVSAYETNKREPGVRTLAKLIEAAGFTLELSLKPGPPKATLRQVVHRHRRELRSVLERLGASNIRLFGSVARGDDRPGSDVDLLVDVDDRVGMFNLGQMKTGAERILGVDVDVVPVNSLKPGLVDAVLADAVAL